MTRTIALEEAFLHPRVWELFPAALRSQYAVLKDQLSEVGARRISLMDAAGIDLQVLSLVQPGVQFLGDPGLAVDVSREVNDWLADVVQKHPDRFAGFATLPTQSPSAAAEELERSVTQLGFRGALINGHTNGNYLDDDAFSILFDRAEALDVPIYLHPTDPPKVVVDAYYPRCTLPLVTGWGWPVETATHLLRMMCAGVFDRHPRLKVVVGHMGELLPYCITRLNLALTFGNWLVADQERKVGGSSGRTMQKSVRYYLRQNVFVTSSGVFDQPVLDCAVAMLGIDHLLFSVDYPFQDNVAGTDFLRKAALSSQEREQFAHGNAERLLKLGPATAGGPSVRGAGWSGFAARTRSRAGRALISLLVK